MANILIVDDDPGLRQILESALSRHQHRVFSSESISRAIELLTREALDIAMVDLRLGQENGIDLLKMIKENWKDLPVMMITAYAESQTAVQAMKLGAEDYIAKPFDIEELLLQVERILKNTRLAEENLWLKQKLQGPFGPIIGESPKFIEALHLTQQIAPTKINVVITGESGTGKELFARALHENSPRKSKPLMIINCGGLPENLVESELFGYRKGAFTGADRTKKGLIEKANKGSFLLDEVAELPLSVQVKLLRCIQDGSFIPVGGMELVQTDVRFIAATNRNIEQEVAEGRFREDLFYRLSGVIIKVPPLRERGHDLFLLAEHFLLRFCQQQNKEIKDFSSKAKDKLKNYRYPGNVRELENIIERAVALESGTYITPSSLIIYEQHRQQSDPSREKVLEGELSIDEHLEIEDRSILQEALKITGGHKGKAARLVGLNPRQFRYRLNKYETGGSGQLS